LLSFVTLLFFWIPVTSFAQTAPAELPPEKARQFLNLLNDPEVKAWLEGKIPAAAKEPPAEPLADAISNWDSAVRARLAALADAIPRIPQELSNAAGVASRDVNSGRPGLVIGILAILIVVGFGAEWLMRRALARVRRPEVAADPRQAVLSETAALLTFALASIGSFLAFQWPPLLRRIVLTLLLAFIAVRVIRTVVSLLFSFQRREPTLCGRKRRPATLIIARYGIDLPPAARAVMARAEETPSPGAFPIDVRMIATPFMALSAAADVARSVGIEPVILGDAIEGEASQIGIVMAGIARSVREHGRPAKPPVVLLSGGEGTVTIGRGAAGRGGRNTEFLLSFAVGIAGAPGIYAIAGDSDGIDGTDDAAGAIVTPDTLARGAASGLSARAHLTGHDSYSYFSALGDLVVTGPTLTNVNDIRAVLIA
jgi:hypothetical protein